MKQGPNPDAAALRLRLAADIAAGRTISLSADDLAHPDVRGQLPQLLEELTGQRAAPTGPVQIPGYSLLGEIGHGGMSTVFLARHETLRRHVALKIAPKWLAGDKRMQQRLLQEARAMARVSHPNVVAIHDILDVEDTVAIAMEWVDGRTLGQLLAELPPRAADGDLQRLRNSLGTPPAQPAFADDVLHFFVRVIRDVALAVHCVHGAGLLHLDIKPSNILVRRDGTPLLADFGVVREIDLEATHTRTFAGTPVYSAPEQLQRQDAAFGPHTDVYALGMTLYELLARQQPLRQLDLTRVLRTVLGGKLPPLASLAPMLPELATIVHKAIAPETEHRYATAKAFADDLTAFLEHRPVAARPLSAPQRLRRWARNEPWKALLAAALAILLPGLAGFALYLDHQMPRIERSRLAELRADASDLRQAAYQNYFVTQRARGVVTAMLQKAMQLDPEPSSLASLLAMALEEGLPTVDAMLVEHRKIVEAHAGLRLFAAKAAAHRAYFDAAEVAELRSSTSRVDKYVLALDRLFFAEDRSHEEAYADAEQCLDEASLMAAEDPLLLGLRMWAAGRAGDPERNASLLRAFRSRWLANPTLFVWICYSQESIDRQRAVADANALQTAHPEHPSSWEMLVGEALRRDKPDPEAAIGRAAAARRAGVDTDLIRLFELTALAMRNGRAAAETALRDIEPALMTETRKLRLLRIADPAAADASRHDMLLAQPTSPQTLKALFHDALAAHDSNDADLAWSQWRRRFPDRRALHFEYFGQLYNRRDVAQAATLLRELTTPRQAGRGQWRVICACLVSARDWESLQRHAARWHANSTDKDHAEAAWYLALAELRTNQTFEGSQHLAEAIETPSEGDQWYAFALLEDAWLRVNPGGPDNLRNAKLAKERLQQFTADWQKRGGGFGPWASLVNAEVSFANGNPPRAIAWARKGADQVRAEPHAPDGLDKMLEAALARYQH